MQNTANVSNGTNGASAMPSLKKQDSDKDFDDYFVRFLHQFHSITSCVILTTTRSGHATLTTTRNGLSFSVSTAV